MSDSNIMKQLWKGEISLAKTYWVWGVLVGIPLNFGIAFFLKLGFTYFALLISCLSIIYGLFITVAIWRSAGNYEGKAILAVVARTAAASSISGFAVLIIYSFM